MNSDQNSFSLPSLKPKLLLRKFRLIQTYLLNIDANTHKHNLHAYFFHKLDYQER